MRPHHGVTATHRPPDLDAVLGSLQTSPNGSWQSLAGEGWRHGKNPGRFHLHMQKVLARAGSGDWKGRAMALSLFREFGFMLGARLEKVSAVLKTKLNLMRYDLFASKTCLKVNSREWN